MNRPHKIWNSIEFPGTPKFKSFELMFFLNLSTVPKLGPSKAENIKFKFLQWTAKNTNDSTLFRLQVMTLYSNLWKIFHAFPETSIETSKNMVWLVIIGITESIKSYGQTPAQWTKQVKKLYPPYKFHKMLRNVMDPINGEIAFMFERATPTPIISYDSTAQDR